MKITLKAPAKINLYLDVGARRPDGYHDIKSIMHTVDLCDTVTVDTDRDGIFLTCSDTSLPTGRENLAYKAAEVFFEKSGINAAAQIHIEKKIPVCGGLAGGSTDAAAVLKGLNEAFDYPFSSDTLFRLGAALGADVPFCINGGCALCEEIGDRLTKLTTLSGVCCVIAKGGEGVCTASAYADIDSRFGGSLNKDFGNFTAVLSAVKNGDVKGVCDYAYNIFEEVVLPRHSTAQRLKTEFERHGAMLSMMSGSGPSVFALFDSEKQSAKAAEAIRSLGADAHLCKLI